MIKVNEIVIPEPYQKAHAESTNHRVTILESKWVGCFYCETIYHPSKTKEWVDNGETALCPFCGIDSVIPITPERFESGFLEKMDEIYFS